MSDNPRHDGITGAVTELGGKAIAGLQGPMLALVLLNAAFIGVAFFFLEHQASARNAMISKMFDVCIASAQATQMLRDDLHR
jgi:hypothetical protein